MSDVSYTWSRFEGNFDLDYSLVSVYNTSSFIQDGPGTNVEDPNRFGPLFEDRRTSSRCSRRTRRPAE